MPSISVIIPVYNDAELLRTCLAALATQTRTADEIVVVDNASTDASAHVARLAGARVVLEPQRGILAATAAGFDAASGDILARLDADSVAPPTWLEQIERCFENRPEAYAVTGTATFYGGTALTRWYGRAVDLGTYFTLFRGLLGHPPLFGSNFAIRTDAWHRMRPRVHRNRSDIHDDLDLSYQVEPNMQVVFDGNLGMQISARPFGSLSNFSRRISWGFRTVWINSREETPWQRRAARRSTAGVERAPRFALRRAQPDRG
ncbi:glycosyltransferase involved in cell wall biosynthesis [Okibacterium sp. HSC-33S16]|uniref:glycosyltransferase family 2 protein n=1 Tax=Okibacterium sp. HSC-33S16 TaxID=2910965 RepID=UPI0020A07907|nr:glycosyltransferase family A protein [Okibacterium sp. HSC-33S16]MCP2032472.1 glycosyltransferase involved in cell wall biosynthesis [Okibacterium sp. HSC-33S16]